MVDADISVEQRTSRRRKITAVLAGGLVLGVGAAVTLAAWNDSEFATGTFGAGTFVFQGSTDGENWSDHANVGEAATLELETNATNLSPNDSTYAAFALRVTGSHDAEVTAQTPTATGDLAGGLTFAAVETTAFGCDATAFAGGATLADPIEIAAEETVNLCLQITADSGIEQGDTATVVWQWDAESQ